MKEKIKDFLKTIPDISVYGIFEYLFLSFSKTHRLFRKSDAIGKQIVQKQGNFVLSGPFKGTKYIDIARGSMLTPKILGSYEAELHNTLEKLVQKNYTVVINIGCGEGYYAVGIARRLPNAIVYAFDIDPKATSACVAMADANGVGDRVVVGTECKVDSFNRLVIPGSTLVICDCEGCEIALLDPERAPALKSADLLVELHDFVNPAITQTLGQRFRSTHTIEYINTTEREAKDYPALQAYGSGQQKLAVDEFRHAKQQWAIMKANPTTVI